MKEWLVSGAWRTIEDVAVVRRGVEYHLLLECAPTKSRVTNEVRPEGGWRVRCMPVTPFDTVLFTGPAAKSEAVRFRDDRLAKWRD